MGLQLDQAQWISLDQILKKKKARRQWIFAGVGVVVLALVAFFVTRLKPAAPEVDRATVWTDTVKRGPLLRQVRGPGSLVPREDKIRLIPAETEATVVRIRVLPGAKVEPDTILMDLVDPTTAAGAAGRAVAAEGRCRLTTSTRALKCRAI